jgi:hypothetical protein
VVQEIFEKEVWTGIWGKVFENKNKGLRVLVTDMRMRLA